MGRPLQLLMLALMLSTAHAAEQSIEVLHWWTAGGEARAADVLRSHWQALGHRWIDAAITGGGGNSAMLVLMHRWAIIPTWIVFILLGNTSSGGAVSASLLLRVIKLVQTRTGIEHGKAYVMCAVASGARPHRILFVHILPNLVWDVLHFICLSCADMTLSIVSFSFIGLVIAVTGYAGSGPNANLGVARSYSVNYLTGAFVSNVLDGGGLPPSPVTGFVNVTVNGQDVTLPFVIGGPGSQSAFGAVKPTIPINSKRYRTYWYREKDQ